MEKRARSRRWFAIKWLIFLLVTCVIYVMGMILFKPISFKDYIAFFTVTTGALISAIGAYIGIVSAKKPNS